MGNPRHIRPDEVEIVVARELRKGGVPLSNVRVVSRRTLGPDDASEYASEYAMELVGTAGRAVLIEFRNEAREVDAAIVATVIARVAPAARADGPKRLQPTEPAVAPTGDALRVIVSTAGFDVGSVREAASLGVMLLRIADGGEAFLRSQWAMGGQPPAWVPEYMAELVDLGPTGDVRYQLITGALKGRTP